MSHFRSKRFHTSRHVLPRIHNRTKRPIFHPAASQIHLSAFRSHRHSRILFRHTKRKVLPLPRLHIPAELSKSRAFPRLLSTSHKLRRLASKTIRTHSSNTASRLSRSPSHSITSKPRTSVPQRNRLPRTKIHVATMIPFCSPFPAATKIHKPPSHKQCPQSTHTAADPSQVHTQRPHIRIQLRRNLAEPDKTHIGRKKLRKPIRTCHHIPISRQKHLHAPGIQNHHQHLSPKHLRPGTQHIVSRLRPSRRKRQRRCIRKNPQQHIPLRQNKQHLKIIPGHHQLQQQLQYGNCHHINPKNRHDPFRRRHILTKRIHRDHGSHHPVIRRPRNLQNIIHNVLGKQNHKQTKTRPEH